MIVLALSDLHSEDRVIDKIVKLTSRKGYDAIFLVGDISDYGNVGYLDELIAAIGDIPIYSIPGNMDDKPVRNILQEKTLYADLRKLRIGNKYDLFGIGGGLRGPFATPYEYDDESLLLKIDDVVLEPPSIVLSHSPPYGYFDDVGMDVHIGSKAVLKFMNNNVPFMLVCGHVHEHKGYLKVGNVNIIKLGPAKKGCAAEIKFSYVSEHKNNVEVNWIKMF
ncbi:MAG: metallophosphoesterase family protein [Candidatus Micrarchaeia archaeon]